MAITYDPATDTMTIVGGSVESRLTQQDMYDADLGGALQLLAPTAPGSGLTLTRQVRPADSLALKVDFILSGSDAGAGDTIHVVGTDKDGQSQAEDVDVSGGDGTYTTTRWFKTITSFDCVGWSAGTVEVQQNRWGVGDKVDGGFFWDCNIEIGSGGAYGYFALEREMMKVADGKTLKPYYRFDVKLGKQTNGHGHDGALLIGSLLGWTNFRFGTFKVYGSVLLCDFEPYNADTEIEVLDSIIAGDTRVSATHIIKNSIVFGSLVRPSGPTAENVVQSNATYGIDAIYGGSFENAKLQNNTYDVYSYNGTVVVTSVSFDRSKVKLDVSPANVSERYPFNFRVTTKLGAGQDSVSVKAYKNGDYTGLEPNDGATPVIDTTTDANGDIPEQIVEIWYKHKAEGISDRNPFLFILEHADYPTKEFLLYIPRGKIEQGELSYAYAEEKTGTHEQILSAISKHDKKLTGLVA